MGKQLTFETALKNLEDAVAQLEEGGLSLDEALSCFETGIQYANQCRTMLKDVETKVQTLIKKSDGKFVTEPFSENNQKSDD